MEEVSHHWYSMHAPGLYAPEHPSLRFDGVGHNEKACDRCLRRHKVLHINLLDCGVQVPLSYSMLRIHLDFGFRSPAMLL